MRISDWSSDVCSSDLVMTILVEHHRKQDPNFDAQAFLAVRRQEFREITGKPLDIHAVFEDKPDRWVRLTRKRTSIGGKISVFSDITDLKLDEQRLRDAIETLEEAYLLYARDGDLVMATHRSSEVTHRDQAKR